MCLGVPGRILSLDDADGALVDFWGVQRRARLDLVDQPVVPGDYVLVHVGYAIRRIPAEDVEATMALYDELLHAADAEDDLMRADVRGEIDTCAPGEGSSRGSG